MSEMKQHCCPECGGDFWPSDIEGGRNSCSPCQQKKRTAYYVSDTYLNTIFSTAWARSCSRDSACFLRSMRFALRHVPTCCRKQLPFSTRPSNVSRDKTGLTRNGLRRGSNRWVSPCFPPFSGHSWSRSRSLWKRARTRKPYNLSSKNKQEP